ncbi:MAG TPA: hypothetical protein VHM65_02945, partial [Candidatus Lustribacter sp.]|nr:hypothetical protein [Candidatus Lustribacter sp.]
MSLRRPRLKSYFRPLERGAGALQLGLDPQAGAVVLEGLSEPEIAFVCGLDGTRSASRVYADASAAGIAPDRTARLLALLRDHGLLVRDQAGRGRLGALPDPLRQALLADAQAFGLVYDGLDDGFHVLAARRRQSVLVGGAGALPWSVATILRAS